MIRLCSANDTRLVRLSNAYEEEGVRPRNLFHHCAMRRAASFSCRQVNKPCWPSHNTQWRQDVWLESLIRRMLPSIGDLSPNVTSAYGVKRKEGASPHVGVDANYNVGPTGQSGINLTHPAVHAPGDGIVTNAGQGTAGRIAIRDANGFSNEILHTHTRHVTIGDRVVTGQLIGTMGNRG